jgi:hypothetical protein
MKKVETIIGTFDEKEFSALRQRYQKAIFKREEEFVLNGKKYVTKFAKFLLELLQPHFQTKQK